MKAGAQQAGRQVPPLIAHAPVCVHDNADEVRAAVRQAGYESKNAFLPTNAGGRRFPRSHPGCVERRYD